MSRMLGGFAGALALLATAGCGGGSPEHQVRDTVQGYAKAFARHDYQALCDRYLAPAIGTGLQSATGVPCESAVRASVSSTRAPAVKVGTVQVKGDRATAAVHSTAAGQAPSDDTMALQRIHGDWRITALAQPDPQPVAP
jgi:ketosteroid isomerase-like protein